MCTDNQVELLLNILLEYKVNETKENAARRLRSSVRWESRGTFIWTCVKVSGLQQRFKLALLCFRHVNSSAPPTGGFCVQRS